jgi:acyl dehydratase
VSQPRALFFDEFNVGDEYKTLGHTVTEADIATFAGLSGDFNPVHVDAAFAATTRFGERIAHGLLGLALAGGFLSRVGLIDGTAVALLDVSWKFTAPILIGDTIKATITVTDKRETSSHQQGIIEFSFALTNQAGTLAQHGTQLFLVAGRPVAER